MSTENLDSDLSSEPSTPEQPTTMASSAEPQTTETPAADDQTQAFSAEPSTVEQSTTAASFAEPQTTETLAADVPNQAPVTTRRGVPDFSKLKKPLWPAIALFMLGVAGLVGWKAYQHLTASTPKEADETTIAQARLPVRVVQARPGLAQQWVFDEGSVLPVRRRVLNFQASGDITYVATINGVELKEGDFVSRGQLLAKIDSRRQTASIQTAKADIQVAVNQRNQSKASLLKTRANVAKAKSDLALARTELGRYQSLLDEGAVPERDRDAAQNRVDQAEAALKIALQDVRAAEDDIRSAEARIRSSHARLNQTAVDLEDTQLVSPIDGVVAYMNIRKGEYWSTQYLNTQNIQSLIETAPIVVVDPRSFEVELEIQTSEANAIRPGQRAYAVLEEDVSAAQASGATRQDLLDIAKQRGVRGAVFAVSPSQTPGGRGTKAIVRNFQQGRNLKVGGRVYVWIEVATKNKAIVIPLGALLIRDRQAYAFVVSSTDNTAQRRRVIRGIESLSGMEILSGVKPGELVVVEGQNRLVEGTPVKIVNPEQINLEQAQ